MEIKKTMPKTIDVIAKDLHYLTEIKATEIKKLKIAFNMCEGGPGSTEEEKQAWYYFTNEFYPYIEKIDKELKDGT